MPSYEVGSPMGMRGHTKETRGRIKSGPLRKLRSDRLVIKCSRGEEVLNKLGLRSDTTVGHVYRKLNVTSWSRVLKVLFG
jgi:hypothetical protein